MKNLLVGSAVALCALAVVPALAQPAPPPAPPMAGMEMMHQRMMPTNRAEVAAHVAAMFAEHDTNKDGVITRDEMMAHMGQMRGMHDMHGEGMDMPPMPDANQAFDRMDTNKDGMLSRDEFKAGRQVRIERRVEIREDGKGDAKAMRDGKMKHGMRMGGGMGMGMFAKADANKDGKLTLAEAQAAALAHFDMVDTNHDGTISDAEHQAARANMKIMVMERRK